MVLAMCDRFHCLPSQLYQEDSESLQMLLIEKLGTREESREEDEDEYAW